MNFAKPKEVFVQNMPIYNNLFQFFPGVFIEERITSERTPFFAENGPFLITENSEFDGSGGYFRPRRLNRLSELDEEMYLIY
jgi:hypothetical protein